MGTCFSIFMSVCNPDILTHAQDVCQCFCSSDKFVAKKKHMGCCVGVLVHQIKLKRGLWYNWIFCRVEIQICPALLSRHRLCFVFCPKFTKPWLMNRLANSFLFSCRNDDTRCRGQKNTSGKRSQQHAWLTSRQYADLDQQDLDLRWLLERICQKKEKKIKRTLTIQKP